MSRISFIVILSFAFLALNSSVEAQKEPLWEWESEYPVKDVAVSDDSRNISAIHGKSISFWDNDTSDPTSTKPVDSEVTSMAMSSDGKYVLIGEELLGDQTVTLWEDGSKVWETSEFLQTVNDVDINSNGTYIAVVDWKNVLFFNKNSDEPVWSRNHADDIMMVVSISPDGLFIAAGTNEGKVYVYPISGDNTSALWHNVLLDESIRDIDFSADSSHLIIGTQIGRVYIYETDEGTQVMQWDQPDEVTCVSGSSNSDYYAFGTVGGLVTVLDLNITYSKWEKNIGGEVKDIDFNGKTTYLVAGSNNEKLVLANATTGEELWITSAFGPVTSVDFSYRGEIIAVSTDAGLAVYYEQQLDNQAPVATIESISPTIALPDNPVVMNGSAVDSDGEIVAYLWHSSVDGNLSTERIFTTSNLTMGLHIITFSAQDDAGRWSKNVTENIGIGDFPEALIVSVSECDLLNVSVCVISEGEAIEFEGTAVSEASNETEVMGYQWSSSQEGILSNNSIFTISNLLRGTHTITFRAVNNLGFWSSNVTMTLLINGVPVISEVSVNSNIVDAGQEIKIIPGQEIRFQASASDADNNDLTYIWTSDVSISSDGNKALIMSETTASDVGSHEVYLEVMDIHGASSNATTITIQILSPPSVTADCDGGEASLGDELVFVAAASDSPPGRIVLFEWDFDSSSGDIDEVDAESTENYAIYSYNSTPASNPYTVVVRVTDDDGLVDTAACDVEIIEGPGTDSSSSDDSSGSPLGLISEIASPPILAGVGLLVLIIGAVTYNYMRRDDQNIYAPTTPKPAPVSGSKYMESVVPEVSSVRQRKVVKRKVVTEMMTVECPECSERMDIPDISGTQQIQCLECGLEGEIEL